MVASKKCLVFGANGYIGRHLVKFLIESGFEVKATDVHDNFIRSNVEYLRVDILNLQDLKDITWDYDYVFNFGGITGTTDSIENYSRYININEIGLLNILTAIRYSNYRPRLIFPSTRLIYKGSKRPLKEEDKKETKTIYAINKIACENYINIYAHLYQIPFTIFRICVPYGDYFDADYSYGTIGFFLNQAKKDKVIRLFGNGQIGRTFTHIEDLCNQMIISCTKDKSINQIYNTLGETYTLKEIGLLIAEKYDAEIIYSDWPKEYKYIESGDTVFDARKIITEFNVTLEHSFNRWLKNVV